MPTGQNLGLVSNKINPRVNKKDGYRQRNVRQFLQSAKAHYLATSRESRRYVVAFTRFAGGGIWLRQESLRHILASLGTPLGESR